jgi:hypothetical protein
VETRAAGASEEMNIARSISYRFGEVQKRTSFALHGASEFLKLRKRQNGDGPKISAVVVARNDDYMSDFAERLRATIDWNIRYLVDEIVLVEWNPPADRELLAYDLTKRFSCLRAYVVPAEVHTELCENEHVKLLEYHAKNVGIRRANSPWIIATNADAAFGFDLINRILTTDLSPDVAWTAERIDIPWREGKQTAIGFSSALRYLRAIPYHELGTGEFILASRDLWHRIRGYDEKMVRHRIGCDVRGTAQMRHLGATIRRAGIMLHLAHPTSCTEKLQPHHGEMATTEGIPYHNGEDWGLGACREEQLAERVWELKRT